MNALKRIEQLEKQFCIQKDGAEPFDRALSEVLREATIDELRIAAGSGKTGTQPTAEEMAAMHAVFTKRAEQKLNQK